VEFALSSSAVKYEQESPRLVLRDPQGSRTVPLEPIPFTIGRSVDRHLTLNNAQVSREHAVINRDDEGLFIQDLASRHGTLVNGVKIERTRLRSGDQIQLGTPSATLLFLAGEAESDGTARSFLDRVSSHSTGSDLEKLSLFLQAAQSFSNTRVLKDVLNTMVEYALRVTGAERGFVFLGDSVSHLKMESGRTKDGEALHDDSKISRSIVRDAAESGSEFIMGDATGRGWDLGRESIIAHELRSVIAIPLRRRASGSLLGLLYLDSRLVACNLSGVSKEILHVIATEAATLVENAAMLQAEQAAALMRKEMEIASSIQQRIIARELPQFPFARVAAKTMQCTEVGGDFYDVIPVKDGFVSIVADVSGKGMSAALLASIIQGMMYAQITTGASLVDTVQAVNAFLCARVSGEKYVTMAVLRYCEGGDVELVNAGHCTPLMCMHGNCVEPIPDGDVPVGLIQGATFHSIRFNLPVGARVVLISDGISEAENAASEQFGDDEMARHLNVDDPIQQIFSAVNQFCEGAPPHDDRTMLTIDRTA
jgi:serine phosphatase RsbU (regulator of sigma subunit)